MVSTIPLLESGLLDTGAWVTDYNSFGIPDSISKKFPDSVIRISVHGANGYVKVTFFRPANPFLAVQKSGAHMLFIVFIACFIVNDSKSVHAGQKKIIQW